MKLLQINSTCGYGSTGRIAVDILNTVTQNGGEGLICYGRRSAPSGVPSYKIGSEALVKLHGALSRITDRQGFYSTKATKELTRQIKEYNPDIIHLHNVHGYYLDIRVLFDYLKDCGKPIVWTLHDCWSFTGHCAFFTASGCEKWKTGCKKCPSKKEYPSSLVFDSSEKNFNEKKELFTSLSKLTLVTPSVWLKDLTKESFMGKYPVKVINNGINTDIFKPTESDFRKKYNLENKTVYLGVASVWEERKGLRDLIKTASLLGKNEKIVLVGLKCEQIANLPDGIIGIERTESAEELAGIYTAADVFLNPTYEDNYPTTNLEAISCGTPVVTYKTGGSPESVANGFGCFVAVGDIDAMYKAAKTLVGVKINSDGEFDARIRYAEYLKLYESLLSD